MTFTLPAPGGNSWITVYRDMAKGEVGMFLSFTRESIGQRATESIVAQEGRKILAALGGEAFMMDRNGIETFADKRHFGNLADEAIREAATTWLATRTNEFVNVLRPAVRSTILDIREADE